MPRTHFCIICAALTALFAILLVLAPSPAVAQDEHTTAVSFGDGDAVVGTGGNLEAIAKLCPAKDAIAGQPTIDVAKAKTMLTTMSTSRARRLSAGSCRQ